MNIYGEGEKKGLSNPLTEDLLANDFNAFQFNEVHLNEIHDNTGTGNIVVHEQFNMTNHKISNLADPTQSKDAVTLSYYQNNIPSVFVPYDIYTAVSDETTPLTIGFQPVTFQVPRTFNVSSFKAYLTTAGTNNLIVSLYTNGSLVTSVDITAGDTFSTTSSISGLLGIGEILEVQINNSDPTAKGLKVVISGSV